MKQQKLRNQRLLSTKADCHWHRRDSAELKIFQGRNPEKGGLWPFELLSTLQTLVTQRMEIMYARVTV